MNVARKSEKMIRFVFVLKFVIIVFFIAIVIHDFVGIVAITPSNLHVKYMYCTYTYFVCFKMLIVLLT